MIVTLPNTAAKADGRLGEVRSARIRRHDQDDVTEVDVLAVVVGQLTVVHHLQQDVEQIGMRLFDLVQQQHAVGMLIDRIGQQAALVEADITGRRPDQPRHGMPLHVLGHVEPGDFDAERTGELARHLGLADPGRTREQVGADRLLRVAQAGACQLDRRNQGFDRRVLTEHHRLQVAVQVLQHLTIVARHALWRDPRHRRNTRLNLPRSDRLAAPALGDQHLGRPGLVDDVDRFVGQLAVSDVTMRELNRGA